MTELLQRSIAAREQLLVELHAEGTDCYRLLHGAVEGRPGLSVDRYGSLLLVQTWREPLQSGELESLAAAASGGLGIELQPVWNHRGEGAGRNFASHSPDPPGDPAAWRGRELGLDYDVRPRHRGQDPLLFLDLRAGRRRVLQRAEGRSVLNLFAYTCGIGVAAVAGGASEAWNVDHAGSALDVGRCNAELNGQDGRRFVTVKQDVIPVIRQLARLPIKGRGARRHYRRFEPRSFELVVLDPPRWAKGPFGAVDVVRDYPSLLKPALLATASGGALLVTNHVPSVAVEDWVDIVQRCAAKAGRPLRSLELLPPEADFPSPDGRPPLKMAWLEV